jgi:hypothetical protein
MYTIRSRNMPRSANPHLLIITIISVQKFFLIRFRFIKIGTAIKSMNADIARKIDPSRMKIS